MCSSQKRGTLRETVDNLRQQVPLRRKVFLLLRNNWIKIRNRSSCCGNAGEPGC